MFKGRWTFTEKIKMKKLITIFLLLFSSTVFSETYSCSLNLSQLGSSGIETQVFKREGKSFIGTSKYQKSYPIQILYEDKNDIILYELGDSLDNKTIMITIISKKYLKFIQDFMISTVVPTEKVKKVIGDCLVSN